MGLWCTAVGHSLNRRRDHRPRTGQCHTVGYPIFDVAEVMQLVGDSRMIVPDTDLFL